MIQRFKHILLWLLTFVASVYAQKFIITRKVYVSIKVNNIAGDSEFRAVCLK